MSAKNLAGWHKFMETRDPADLPGILHDDVVFISPVVHTPQRGKAKAIAYLTAAGQVLPPESFRYVREFDCGDRVVLEFVCEVNGIQVNAVDMIEWDENGLITEFKVMARPLKGIEVLRHAMADALERQAG